MTNVTPPPARWAERPIKLALNPADTMTMTKFTTTLVLTTPVAVWLVGKVTLLVALLTTVQ